MRMIRAGYVLLFLAAFACACKSEAGNYSHLTIIVDAGPELRELVTAVRLEYPHGRTRLTPTGDRPWPLAKTFYAEPGKRGRVTIHALNADGKGVLTRVVEVSFPRGRHALTVLLADACLSALACEDDLSCGDCGTCAPSDDVMLYPVASEEDAVARYLAGSMAPDCSSIGSDAEVPDMDGGMEASVDGGDDADADVGDLTLDVPAVVATNTCVKARITRQNKEQSASAALEASLGGFFVDAACESSTDEVNWPRNRASATVYYGAPKALDGAKLVDSAQLSVTLADHADTTAMMNVELRLRARALSRGHTWGCVLLDDGRVQCFGDNSFGMLATPGGPATVPVLSEATGHPDAHMISGEYNTCFLHNGGLRCFGAYDGKGFGSAPAQAVNDVEGLNENVISASIGKFQGCAVQDGATRSLWCWGQHLGECGGPAGTLSSPQKVTLLADEGITTPVVECALGRGPTCVRLEDGSVRCWSGGYDGIATPLESGAVALSMAAGETCAVVQVSGDQEVRCWTAGSNPTPFTIRFPEDTPKGPITHLTSMGESTTDYGGACAIKGNALYCWGNNTVGWFSPATTDDRDRAIKIDLPEGKVEDVAVGYVPFAGPTFSVIVNGLAYSWGCGRIGASGLDDRQLVVTRPTTSTTLTGLDIVDLTIGPVGTCVRFGDGTAGCLGDLVGNGQPWVMFGNHSDTPYVLAYEQTVGPSTELVSIGGVSQVLPLSDRFGFAIATDGETSPLLWAWGLDFDGVLQIPGDARQYLATSLSRVNDLPVAPKRITGGTYGADLANACAWMVDGSVYCWGRWPGSDEPIEPTQVMGPGDAVRDIASSCVLNDDVVECWNDDSWARSPVPGLPTEGVDAFDASSGVVCARVNSEVTCIFADDLSSMSFSDASYVGVGADFACVLTTDGRVACGGHYEAGQLGRAVQAGTSHADPAEVPGLSNVTKLAVGWKQSCALSDETWKCWGENSAAHLGITPLLYSKPVLLPAWGGAP